MSLLNNIEYIQRINYTVSYISDYFQWKILEKLWSHHSTQMECATTTTTKCSNNFSFVQSPDLIYFNTMVLSMVLLKFNTFFLCTSTEHCEIFENQLYLLCTWEWFGKFEIKNIIELKKKRRRITQSEANCEKVAKPNK